MEKEKTTAANALFEMLTMNNQKVTTTSDELLQKFLTTRRMDFKIGALQRIVAATYFYHSKNILLTFKNQSMCKEKLKKIKLEHFCANNGVLIIENIESENSLICTIIMAFKE